MMKGIKQINHYKLYKELGKGLNKTVYLAVDERTDNLIIVKAFNNYKQLRLNSGTDPLELIKGLKKPHDCLVRYLGREKTSNNLYLCLEFVNGGSLSELLRAYQAKYGAPMSEGEVQVVMKQLIDGFEFLESNALIQRDIELKDIHINYPAVNKKGLETGVDKLQLFKSARFNLKIDWITINFDEQATRCSMSIPSSINEPMKVNQRQRPALWSLGSIAFELLFGVKYAKSLAMQQKSTACISSEANTFLQTLLGTINHTQLTWKSIREMAFICSPSSSFHMKYYMDSLLDSLKSNDSINSEYYSFIDLHKKAPPKDEKQFEVIAEHSTIEQLKEPHDKEEDEEDKWEVISVHTAAIELNDIESIDIVNNYLNI